MNAHKIGFLLLSTTYTQKIATMDEVAIYSKETIHRRLQTILEHIKYNSEFYREIKEEYPASKLYLCLKKNLETDETLKIQYLTNEAPKIPTNREQPPTITHENTQPTLKPVVIIPDSTSNVTTTPTQEQKTKTTQQNVYRRRTIFAVLKESLVWFLSLFAFW